MILREDREKRKKDRKRERYIHERERDGKGGEDDDDDCMFLCPFHILVICYNWSSDVHFRTF